MEYVGVFPWSDLAVNPLIKRDALLFDKIAVSQLPKLMQHWKRKRSNLSRHLLNDFEFLIDNNVVFEPKPKWDGIQDGHEFDESVGVHRVPMGQIMGKPAISIAVTVPEGDKAAISAFVHKYGLFEFPMSRYHARMDSIALRKSNQVNAVSIISNIESMQVMGSSSTHALSIVLEKLSILDDSTPWEDIFNYRNDPKTKLNMMALRNWVGKVVRGKYTSSEIREEAEFLIETYNNHMNFYRAKTRRGTVEILVTTTAEVLEDVIKFRIGKIVKGLFSIRACQFDLMEAELKAPGKEIAYIIKTNEKFS